MPRSRRRPRPRPAGAVRIGEASTLIHRDDYRLTVYLPAFLADQAEAQAVAQGEDSLQSYCERLLRSAIQAEQVIEDQRESARRRQINEDLQALAEDSEAFQSWAETMDQQITQGVADQLSNEMLDAVEPSPQLVPAPAKLLMPSPDETPKTNEALSTTIATILKHAGIGHPPDPQGFLPALRSGGTLEGVAVNELIEALRSLEAECQGQSQLDRRIAYPVYRLAFEGQVLITDAWINAAIEPATLNLLRMIQELADRILSGAPAGEPNS